MTKTKFLLVGALLTVGLGAAGCSSSSSCAVGGICVTGAGGAGGGAGPTLYAVTPGTWCFTVTSIQPGAVDGCDIGVAAVVGTDLPVTYDMAAGTISVGTAGSLGIGAISANKATLLRENSPADKDIPACIWHQTDTSMLTLTADNTFTISVTENEDTFNAVCTANSITPAGGACASTWTWTMAIDGSMNASNCH